MRGWTCLLLLTSSQVAVSLRVLRTDPTKFLPDLDGQAEVLNSELAEQDEVTVCARFITFQFNCPQDAYDYQGMITLEKFWLLGTYMALPCDWSYEGCTVYKKSYIKDWRHGTAFGYYEESNFYPSWEPGRWNSFCFTGSSLLSEANVFINGDRMLNIKKYSSDHKKPGKNLRLMNNHESTNPMHGAMTDVSVWSRVLTDSEVSSWSACGSVTGDKLVDWTTAALNVSGLEVEERERDEICAELNRRDQLMVFDDSKTFDGILKFCVDVGGKFAVARDESSFSEMMSLYNQTCRSGLSFFYSGYTDREEQGKWVDVTTGEEMVWENWLDTYPTTYTSDDCTYGDLNDKQIYNADCISKVCPICQMEKLKRFQLRGICLDSSVDTYFVMTGHKEFLGLLQSRMIFSSNESRWEIVNSSDSSTVLAYMEGDSKFPLGRQSWHFLDVNCSDSGQASRDLNFHLSVSQPGQFCCDDGACINSQLVCNNFPDCQDRSDERDCSIILFPDYTYNKDYPPVEFKQGKKQSLKLFTNLTVLNIFEINEVDSSFDFYFMILVQWFDKNLNFEFLKDGNQGNSIPERFQSELWMPHIEFDDLTKTIKSYQPELFITKLAAPKLDGDTDEINIKEIYSGQENPLTIQIKKRIKFSCSFNNIKNFPFGKQVCSMNFYILGSDNQLTELTPDQLINFGPEEIGQYVIENWQMNSTLTRGTEEKVVEVSMILTRKIGSVFMVTYLPTILMNMINQVTNYINGDTRYDLVFTINITCMMVLASVYLSVSVSLPSTSDIKPVEIWLLFNLAYPFLVIFVNVLLQVKLMSNSPFETNWSLFLSILSHYECDSNV